MSVARGLGVVGLGIVALSSAGLLLESSVSARSGESVSAQQPAVGLPLRFEPNRGQLDPEVRFLARGPGYGLYLTDDGATLALQRRKPGSDLGLPKIADVEQTVVSMRLVGANRVSPQALDPLSTRTNYFTGSDPAKWKTNVESYARVLYPNALPGVDVVYYGSERQELEYDFVLGPGIDPASIELAFEGAREIEIDALGDAVLKLKQDASLRQRAPIAYQRNDDGRKVLVAARWEKRAHDRLGFAVGLHDANRPLVIDPLLTYSTYYGGGGFDEATSGGLDAAGNAYVVGYTSSTLLPTHSPVQPVHGGGTYDAFICKLNTTGSAIVYATYLGGNGPDIAYGIRMDAFGNAYIAGLTSSTNFPAVSAVQPAPGGLQDAFVAKLNASGSILLYSTYLGGSADDFASGVSSSNGGNALVVGTTFSADFPTASPLQGALSGTQDAFVASLSPSGAALVYSSYLGGTNIEFGTGIASDGLSAYVAGTTASTNFPTASALQAAYGGGAFDAFASKLDPSGASLAFSTYLGGSGRDEGTGIALDSSNRAHVVGHTLSNNFPTLEPAQAVRAGTTDAFASKLSPAGSALVYSTYLGGTAVDRALAVTVDTAGSAHVVGFTESTNFPALLALQQSAGSLDAFITKFNPTGSVNYSTYFGGNNADRAVGVSADGTGIVGVVGSTLSTNFPLALPIIFGLVGSQDTFIVKLAPSAAAPATSFRTTLLLAALLLGLSMFFVSRRIASPHDG